MKSLEELLNEMGSGISQGNTPISSTTEASAGDDVCPICGGLGYVRRDLPLDHPQFGKLFPCPGNHPKADAGRVEKLRKLSNLDAFLDKTFDNFRTDLPMLTPSQQASIDTAYKMARSFAENPQGWLLLEGGYGSGKTHLAAAVGNTRLAQGDAVLFITSPDLLDHLRSAYAPSSDVVYDDVFDRIRSAPLLILDDLGTENPSQWAQEKLFQLLNYRYSHGLATVVTTNTDLDLLDPRLRSRLLDDSIIRRVKLNVPDFRTGTRNEYDQLLSHLSLYQYMLFANFDTGTRSTPAEKANLERALNLASSYAAEGHGSLLLLMGPYGTGKTHLAAGIANFWTERGSNVMFVTVPDLLDYLRVTFDPNSPVNFDKRFQMVRNAPYLVLDDLGTENTTAWAREKLFQIIDYRYVARLTTVITTAKGLEELDERIVNRLLDTRYCTRFAITAEAYVKRIKREHR